ncbi:DUF5134 domain-containing protein [Micromonospora zingiberis]|nr:DUF5134 domain-containing protein [Micromonospora zingiberis]
MTLALMVVVPYFTSRLLHPARRQPGTGPAPAGWSRMREFPHLLMATSMVAMVWPIGIPAQVWIALFAPIAVWFTVRAARSRDRLPHGSRAVATYFAVSTAAMVWMAAAHGVRAGGHHGGMPEATSWWSPVVSLALGGYLLLSAGWWASRGLRLTPRWQEPGGSEPPESRSGARADGICHAAMGMVMGLMLLAMV